MGKSSLCRAAVLPAVAEVGLGLAEAARTVIGLTPGRQPLEALAEALAPLLGRERRGPALARAAEEPGAFARALRQPLPRRTRRAALRGSARGARHLLRARAGGAGRRRSWPSSSVARPGCGCWPRCAATASPGWWPCPAWAPRCPGRCTWCGPSRSGGCARPSRSPPGRSGCASSPRRWWTRWWPRRRAPRAGCPCCSSPWRSCGRRGTGSTSSSPPRRSRPWAGWRARWPGTRTEWWPGCARSSGPGPASCCSSSSPPRAPARGAPRRSCSPARRTRRGARCWRGWCRGGCSWPARRREARAATSWPTRACSPAGTRCEGGWGMTSSAGPRATGWSGPPPSGSAWAGPRSCSMETGSWPRPPRWGTGSWALGSASSSPAPAAPPG